jgi:hypothetical protein
MKTWQHDETGRITEAAECPGPRWAEIPVRAWGTSTVSTPEYQQEQREKNQRARDLVDGLARKGEE